AVKRFGPGTSLGKTFDPVAIPKHPAAPAAPAAPPAGPTEVAAPAPTPTTAPAPAAPSRRPRPSQAPVGLAAPAPAPQPAASDGTGVSVSVTPSVQTVADAAARVSRSLVEGSAVGAATVRHFHTASARAAAFPGLQPEIESFGHHGALHHAAGISLDLPGD